MNARVPQVSGNALGSRALLRPTMRNPMKNMIGIAFSLACVSAFAQACTFPRQSEPDTRAADEAAIRQADIAWSKTGETRATWTR